MHGYDLFIPVPNSTEGLSWIKKKKKNK